MQTAWTPRCADTLDAGTTAPAPLAEPTEPIGRISFTGAWDPPPPPPRSAELEGLPDCLIYSGNVPEGGIPEAQSLDMCGKTDWGPADAIPRTGGVATDGSSRRQGAGFKGGWGGFWGPGDWRNCGGPLRGPEQTAPGAEIHVVAKAPKSSPWAEGPSQL